MCSVEGLSLHPTPYTLHTEHSEVIRRLRSVIVSALQGNTLNIQSLRDIVDFMRKHDAQFPEFRQSATYKLFFSMTKEISEAQAIEERKKFVHGFNDTMIKIWQEQITLLGVIDTGALLATPKAFPVRADGRFFEVGLSQAFLEICD